MPARLDRLLAGLGLVLLTFTASSGCQSRGTGPNLGTPPMFGSRPAPAAKDTALAIAPQSVVRWSVASGHAQRTPAVTGRDVVAPDGTLRVGPYGSVAVGGLTAEDARTAIVNHVARQVTDPRVHLQVEGPVQPTGALRRLLTKNNEPPLLPEAGSNWQYGSPPPASGKTNRIVPVSGMGTPTPPAKSNAGEKRPDLGVSKLSPQDSRIQPVSASEPELAPQPQVLMTPPPMIHPHPAPCDKPLPREMSQVSLPPYVIDPPDILLVEAVGGIRDQPVRGQHLVRPDGTISLGIYGQVHVAGRTLEEARIAIANQLATRAKIDQQNVHVDVLAYNSKFYYVVTDGAGYGEQVVRVPITGSETVLDALSQVNGLPPVASKKHIWVARRAPNDGHGHQILPVDWVGITQRASTATNYQIMPGDRVYVQSDKLIRIDNGLAKILNPIERLLGVTLLGSSVVNSIQGRNLGGTGGGF